MDAIHTESFQALADPTRCRIVEMLAAAGELSASDIGRHFTISAPAVSQHLKILRQAGLVRVEARAQQRIYTIDPGGFAQMETWARQVRQFWGARFDALDTLLKEEVKKAEKDKTAKVKISKERDTP